MVRVIFLKTCEKLCICNIWLFKICQSWDGTVSVEISSENSITLSRVNNLIIWGVIKSKKLDVMFIFHKSHLCQILYGGVKIINFSPKKLKLGDLSKLGFLYNNACVSSTLVCLVPNYIYMCICVPAVYVYFYSYVISVPSNPILSSLHRNFLQAVKYGTGR